MHVNFLVTAPLVACVKSSKATRGVGKRGAVSELSEVVGTGIIVIFVLCVIIATAGKRGSAPTMVLSRAAYGVRGNRLPSFISWLLCVGWETVLTVIAVLATSTVFTRLGWGGGDGVKAVAIVIIAALIIVGGVMGFDLIMRMQAAI